MQTSSSQLYFAVGLFGGLAFPLYSVCIAHTNDRLEPSQMIAASGALMLVGGLGAVAGPVLIASIMDLLGEDSFFWAMGAVHGLIGLFALYRMARRKPIPLGKQGPNTPTAVHPSVSTLENVQQYSIDETSEESGEETPLE
jgi:MFS family permease